MTRGAQTFLWPGDQRHHTNPVGNAAANKYRARTFSYLRPLKPTIVFESYWRFAAERQNVFFRRLCGDSPPWTSDPVLLEHKFTNAYRASDRVSQFLIREVIYRGDPSPEETVFRTLLFKFFNKIETWELLLKELGPPSVRKFKPTAYSAILEKAIAKGQPIYSAAYMMPSGGPGSPFRRKHEMHLSLLERMISESVLRKITDQESLEDIFSTLRTVPTLGDFLAFQYTIDLNYSAVINFDENDFVVAGPGARDGIRKCFSELGGLSEAQVIRFVTENQSKCFTEMEIRFPSLWGRDLKLIDCQNLFCEIGKYSRVAHPEFSGASGRTRIKQKFRPKSKLPDPWYPPKWGINERISKTCHHSKDT